jgi:ferredoxin
MNTARPPETDAPPGARRGSTMPATGLSDLVAELRRRGYRVIAPVARDGALVLDEIIDADELPFGVGVEQGPGRYRLTLRTDRSVFANAVGPMPWKRFLRPPREKILDVDLGPDGEPDFHEPDAGDEPPLAFLGVRPCDLRALEILDRVLLVPDARSAYATRRARAFIVVVECTEPAETCFCVSAGSGPGLGAADNDAGRSPRYDLVLTELPADHGRLDAPYFLARTGSCRGAEVFRAVTHRPADAATAAAARAAVERAAGAMSRALPNIDLRALMAASTGARHWRDIAQRCLACGNCTLVCPTCFCASTEDATDLTGEHAERWLSWDSCFDLDFSYVHGGEVRPSAEARYRQWATHKFATWHDQFGTGGCVGCGRCIAWCPAGIDLTAELRALQQEWELEANSE